MSALQNPRNRWFVLGPFFMIAALCLFASDATDSVMWHLRFFVCLGSVFGIVASLVLAKRSAKDQVSVVIAWSSSWILGWAMLALAMSPPFFMEDSSPSKGTAQKVDLVQFLVFGVFFYVLRVGYKDLWRRMPLF